jgi:hypothetical protein
MARFEDLTARRCVAYDRGLGLSTSLAVVPGSGLQCAKYPPEELWGIIEMFEVRLGRGNF